MFARPPSFPVRNAILKHAIPRWMRTRYQVRGPPDPERLLGAMQTAMRRKS